MSFRRELEELINKHGIENKCDVPDFILTKMIIRFIDAIGEPIKETLDWHGCDSVCHPANKEKWIWKKIIASEALFGFMAWLTTRQEAVTFGASHECSVAVDLIKEWSDENKLEEPRDGIYPDNIKHPKEK